MRTLASRLFALFRKRRDDNDLRDEIQAHLGALTDEYVRRGMSAPDARAAARREFGGVDQLKEIYRDQRSLPWLDTLMQDVRYALRALRANPGFTAAAIMSLALGIGANSAVFGVLNAAMLRDLPVSDPDRVSAASAVRPPGVRERPSGEGCRRSGEGHERNPQSHRGGDA